MTLALSPQKHLTRLGNLQALSHAQKIRDEDTGLLLTDWLELAGDGAPTLRLLLEQGLLGPASKARYIGVDHDPKVLAHCQGAYPSDAPAVWENDDLIDKINNDHAAYPNVGVLCFDSYNAARGREIEDILDVLFAFAERRARKEFLLILNVSLKMVPKGAIWYKDAVSRRLGTVIPPSGWTEYRSDARKNNMLLTRIRFGF